MKRVGGERDPGPTVHFVSGVGANEWTYLTSSLRTNSGTVPTHTGG